MGKKTAAPTLIEDGKLGDVIGKFRASMARKWNESHSIAYSAVAAYAKIGADGKPCNNTFYINEFYNALGHGSRHVALTAWLLAFGGVSANTDKAKAKAQPFVHDKDKRVNLELAAKTPWFMFKPSSEPAAVLDALAMALKLLKTLSNPKEGQTVQHPGLVEAMTATVEQYELATAEDTKGATDTDGDASDDVDDTLSKVEETAE